MADVSKQNGNTEPFDRMKLEKSLQNAGVNSDMARELAKAVPDQPTSSQNIRTYIVQQLKAQDPSAAERYDATIRLEATQSSHTLKGIAKLTPASMERLGVKSGEAIRLLNENRDHTVTVEDGVTGNSREIQLHTKDMQILGAHEGTRIAVQRKC